MHEITEQDIAERMRLDNPWWETGEVSGQIAAYLHRRDYFDLVFDMARRDEPHRALVLMGPRRVGKTVLLQQVIQGLIGAGVHAGNILYLSLDTPIYNRIPLEKLLDIFRKEIGSSEAGAKLYVFYDEVQYLKDWEVHLKSLVDTFRNIKLIVSGSAAAALRMKSDESGAGRFTNLMLPPLTFAEYLVFRNLAADLITPPEKTEWFGTTNIQKLNAIFVDYLNHGGYPEVALSEAVQENLGQFVRADIIDKVLLRDLPSLYGINDIQELNSLFMTLAYNTAGEMTFEELAKRSSVAKQTIKRYLEYLEAAYLISKVERIDRNAKRFQKVTSIKVYLTNPSLRAALFGPVDADDTDLMGALAETAAFAQWHPHPFGDEIRYARWKDGEVDMVSISKKEMKPRWVVEIKWSDRFFHKPSGLKSLLEFVQSHADEVTEGITATTRTETGDKLVRGFLIRFVPTSLYCYTVGKRQAEGMTRMLGDSKQALR
jgi:predicted AAA+ superfamily ATPase